MPFHFSITVIVSIIATIEMQIESSNPSFHALFAVASIAMLNLMACRVCRELMLSANDVSRTIFSNAALSEGVALDGTIRFEPMSTHTYDAYNS